MGGTSLTRSAPSSRRKQVALSLNPPPPSKAQASAAEAITIDSPWAALHSSLKQNVSAIFGPKVAGALLELDLRIDGEEEKAPARQGDAAAERAEDASDAEGSAGSDDESSRAKAGASAARTGASNAMRARGRAPVRVTGLISRPSSHYSQSTSSRQFYYINGRPWDCPPRFSRTFNDVYRSFHTNELASGRAASTGTAAGPTSGAAAASQRAASSSGGAGTDAGAGAGGLTVGGSSSASFPFVVADFHLPADRYDVNVSPDKRTIWLERERELAELLRDALEDFYKPHRSVFKINAAAPSASQLPLAAGAATAAATSATQRAPGGFVLPTAAASKQVRQSTLDGRVTVTQITGRAASESDSDEEQAERMSADDSEESDAARPSSHGAGKSAARRAEDAHELSDSDVEGEIAAPSISSRPLARAPSPSLTTERMDRLAAARKASRVFVEASSSDEEMQDAKRASEGAAAPQAEAESPDRQDGDPAGPTSSLPLNERFGDGRGAAHRPSTPDPEPSASALPLCTTAVTGNGAAHPSASGHKGSASASRPTLAEISPAKKADDTLRRILAKAERDSHSASPMSQITKKRRIEADGAEVVVEDDSDVEEVAAPSLARARGETPLVERSRSQAAEATHADDAHEDGEEEEARARNLSRLDETGAGLDAAAPAAADPEVVRVSRLSDSQNGMAGIVPVDIAKLCRAAEKRHARLEAGQSKAIAPASNHDATMSTAETSEAGFQNEDAAAAEGELSRTIHQDDFLKRMAIVGQFNLAFVIARRQAPSAGSVGETSAQDDDLFIIDQHAADEKYNFEELQQTTKIRRQPLLM